MILLVSAHSLKLFTMPETQEFLNELLDFLQFCTGFLSSIPKELIGDLKVYESGDVEVPIYAL